jgi:outer membrane murein-binding lipoprotein Lpp
MRTLTIIAAGGIAALMLTGCQTTQESMQVSGATRLDKAQVAALYTDHTVPWASGQGASYHAPDGSYSYKSKSGDTGAGTWRVSDEGSVCLDVAAWGGETCYEVWDESGKIVVIDPKGKKSNKSDGTKGNVL